MLSILRYGIEVYCKSQSNAAKLQKTLNSALRLITKGDRYSSVEKMLKETGWLNIPNLIRQQKCEMLIKIINTRVCKRVHDSISRNYTNTRSSPDSLSWHHRTSFGDKSFLISAWKTYSKLNIANLNLETNKKPDIKSLLINHFGNTNI